MTGLGTIICIWAICWGDMTAWGRLSCTFGADREVFEWCKNIIGSFRKKMNDELAKLTENNQSTLKSCEDMNSLYFANLYWHAFLLACWLMALPSSGKFMAGEMTLCGLTASGSVWVYCFTQRLISHCVKRANEDVRWNMLEIWYESLASSMGNNGHDYHASEVFAYKFIKTVISFFCCWLLFEH